jgi:NADPH2:quinone reductase
MKAIVIEQSGGPEVLAYRDAEAGEPAAGQVRVRVEAAGVNYIDTYQRSGLYPMPLPFTPGVEGAGVVDAVGDGVTGVAAGDRVVYVMTPGSYAELALVPAAHLVRIPEGITTELAGAAFLQGLTAHYLACSTYPLSPSSTCLVLAAAGGVGLLLSQIAKRRGARVIGCVSSDAKAELARGAGCDEVIRYDRVDFKDEVLRRTGGRGVQVAYDSVAAATSIGFSLITEPSTITLLPSLSRNQSVIWRRASTSEASTCSARTARPLRRTAWLSRDSLCWRLSCMRASSSCLSSWRV